MHDFFGSGQAKCGGGLLQKSRERLLQCKFVRVGGALGSTRVPSCGSYWMSRGPLGATWVPLGGLVGRLGGVLGASWCDLGTSWEPRGVSWDDLAASWEPLGATWVPLEGLVGPLGPTLWGRRGPWALLGTPRRLLSTPLSASRGAPWEYLGLSWGSE